LSVVWLNTAFVKSDVQHIMAAFTPMVFLLALLATNVNKSPIGAAFSPSATPREGALNINGMRSGNVGDQATNMIAETATAVLDLRLVLGNEPHRQYEKLLAYVRSL